ncbi:gliding motility-associated protein GldE [Flavobacterium sp. '19STA2R22 D10 B1']|uniref:gliding motility-associated protein GldE n=1 Tax=Flavobacterium aerium TaxID=3037261 RepID=UPI00278C84B2|nr:gliding motility-associated protein GldE [Flavobacterium sp. '19STA2R22 D10 B1']
MDADPSNTVSILETIDINLVLGFVGIILLLFCSAMSSAAEIALFSLTRKDLEKSAQDDSKIYQIITALLSKPKKLLATILVVNNFFNIGIVIIFSFLSERLFSHITPYWLRFSIEVGVVTFLILLFGEVIPKVYANRNNLKFAKFIAVPLSIINRLLTPISVPMRSITVFLHKRLGKQKTYFSVDQLSQALELTSSEETSTQEQKILAGIVSFGNTDVKQVMSPRIDVFALDIEESFEEIIAKIIDKGYSRIPVYKDNIDQIEGVLFVKDVLPHIDKESFDWKTLLRTPFFVPENKKLDDLLKEFQSMKNHLAVVVDEYGGTSGLVSLEDIIEEIVGDISDEFDDDNINFSQIDEHNFLFEGKINLKDFYRIVPVNEEVFENQKGEAETLAGFILEVFGNFPKKGQKINFQNCLFTIEGVDKKRVKQIKVTLENR